MMRSLLFGAATCLALAQSVAADGLPRPLSDDDFPKHSAEEVKLGQLLFYDPILSGNQNISCATCHHPKFATGDGVSLGLGEGGIGLGPERRADPKNPPEQRIPRNAPPLFNVGAKDQTVLFHDGRIEADASRPSGLRTPMGTEMEQGFASLLSAQTMFPVLSADEMAGHYTENDVSKAVRQGVITGPGGAWDIIAQRVRDIPEYQALFAAAYPDRSNIHFTDISDAIAAFMTVEWRADNSAFDAFLSKGTPLTGPASDGRTLFFGAANCSTCHFGSLLTDNQFHAMGQPQLGPGKAAKFERHQKDVGRMRVTGQMEDAYAFRTPPLRNVVHTGPWGHAGAFSDLKAFLAHHANPKPAIEDYRPQATLPEFQATQADWAVMDSEADRDEIRAAIRVTGRALSLAEIDSLFAFLESLTDTASLNGRLGVPARVPSGLPVDQ